MGTSIKMVVELGDCNIKWCHSRGAPDELPHWRRVPGFPVFGVGQPSESGFPKIAEKVSKDKLIWFNMRQEPVAYVEDSPSLQESLPILMTILRFLEMWRIWRNLRTNS